MQIKITLYCPDSQSTKIKKNGNKSYGKQNYLALMSRKNAFRFSDYSFLFFEKQRNYIVIFFSYLCTTKIKTTKYDI